MRSPVIELSGVGKTYRLQAGDVVALDSVDLSVGAGEFVAVVGRSGSGKTTLLNLMAGIDRATTGRIAVAGTVVDDRSEDDLARWRAEWVGLVFQFFQLLPTLTVAENVMLPMDFLGRLPVAERAGRAVALLDRVGIADQAGKLPSSLSGGQQQRAAIARALANDPPVVLADEPTGNLDSATADAVLALFGDLADDGRTVVMVTHERDVSAFASRQVTLSDGRLDGDRLLAAGSVGARR